MNSSDNIKEDISRRRDAFVERLLTSTSGAFDIFTIFIGHRLGFYRALAQDGT